MNTSGLFWDSDKRFALLVCYCNQRRTWKDPNKHTFITTMNMDTGTLLLMSIPGVISLASKALILMKSSIPLKEDVSNNEVVLV